MPATAEREKTPDKIVDGVTVQVVNALLDNPTVPFNKSQLAEAAGVSRDALYRRWDAFVGYGIVEKADVASGKAYWTLNSDSDTVDALARIIHPEQ
ncbi:MAG: hypothetical protein SVV03_03555 [Candidatus Nanohaloarchaea archaeon]|nr:hypothetical protein [Candidatus Nanohaloarchaea archaeon]